MKNICKSCKYFNQCGDFSRIEKCDGYIAGLQTIEEIEEQIKLVNTTLDLQKSARTENSKKSSELYANYRTLANTGKEAEIEAIKSALDAVRKNGESIIREIERDEALRTVLANNKKIVLVNDALTVVIEEFTKFNNKPYGEKTRRKISDAIYEKCGFRAYISTPDYSNIRDSMTIYKSYDVEETLYTPYNEEARKRPQLLVENKINADAVRQLKSEFFTIDDYVVNPAAYIAELTERKKAIEEAEKTLNNAANEYNTIAIDNAKLYIHIRKTVYTY